LRAIIGTVVGVLAFAAVSAHAGPVATKVMKVESQPAPSIELVRQGCGWGWHRVRWWDQWGYWHWGRCVPNW
jgi:hypothetical protein